MADGALDARRRGRERLGDLRVQDLRDGVDDVHVLYGDHDRLAQILIALDVRRNADLMDDGGDHCLDVDLLPPLGVLTELTVDRGHLVDALGHGVQLARLRHEILHAETRRHVGDVFRHKARQHQRCRRLVHLTRPFQDRDAVQLRQHQIQYQDIRLRHAHKLCRALPVGCRTDDLIAGNLFQTAFDVIAKLLISICDQNFDTVFHS